MKKANTGRPAEEVNQHKLNLKLKDSGFLETLKVARYSFSGSITPKCERELRRHLQRFGEINSTVVLDKDETLL